MNIEQQISSLLYHQDCIIIPGFGGFVANHRSAFLNPAHHTFSPPSKKIAFNSSLRISDGLLANHISKTTNVTYKEAGEQIDHFVKNCMTTLNNGERLVLENLGSLFYDAEKNLQFVPDNTINYLKDSFGLTTIHSPAIKRDDDISNLMNVIHKKTRSKNKKKIKSWRLIELIPAAAILIWLLLSPPVLTNINPGNLNPFTQPKLINYPAKETVESKHNYFNQESNNPESTTQLADTFATQSSEEISTPKSPAEELLETPGKPMEEVVAKKESEAVPSLNKSTAKETAVETNPAEIAHAEKLNYVIGGCFRDYNNAVNFRDEAIADGLQAAIIGLSDKGLHMVSLFSSNDASRARAEMQQIKEKFQPQAWLFRK